MSFNDFMNKVRYLDNLAAKWLMRHFYFMFFQIVLVGIFVFWFINTLSVVNTVQHVDETNNLERILATQSVNQTIIVLLFLLNSFWMLYVFNGIQRITTALKDMTYHLSKLRVRNTPTNPS